MHLTIACALTLVCISCCYANALPPPSAELQAKRATTKEDAHSGGDAHHHADLPTKFGDEDDVIAMKHGARLPPQSTDGDSKKGASSRGGKSSRRHHQPAFGLDAADDVESYDDDDDDDDMEDMENGDDAERDESHYKSNDYGDEEEEGEDDGELGPPLENFGDAKLDGGGADGGADRLPSFLTEPQSTYVIRSRAAVLKCVAAHALQVRDSARLHISIMHFLVTFTTSF